jgi:hypothetical protein
MIAGIVDSAGCKISFDMDAMDITTYAQKIIVWMLKFHAQPRIAPAKV